jgi:hypothetical protein
MNRPSFAPCRCARCGWRWLGALLALASLVAAPGCNRGPQFAAVEGTVRLDGRPLREVEVVFLPDPEAGTLGPSSSAYTDERGHYNLATAQGQSGAVVGTHRVCLRDLATLPLPTPRVDSEGRPGGAGPPGAKQPVKSKPARVPPQYSSATQTPLRNVEVRPGMQPYDVDLSSLPKR